jgi:peptidoglycan/xylan/chitin deacetylase (PgdA/CDA1 family)
MITKRLRRVLLAGATSRSATAILRTLTRGTATVLMLHRFTDRARGVTGHDPGRLAAFLETLRAMGCRTLPLGEVFGRLQQGEPFDPLTVAFTLDDGYLDQAEVAAPIFAEYDCPATIFVTTGFLDGDLWFWWDKITHVVETTARPEIELDLPGGRRTCDVRTSDARTTTMLAFTEFCKALADADKHAAIAAFAHAAEVDVPGEPPPRYVPMSWDQLRRLEARGLSFGPHTVTHPVLARTDDDRARHEVAESWSRLQAEARAPLPVFCYPNGQPGDFGDREIANLAAHGLTGAVTGIPGFADPRAVARVGGGLYRVPRFAYDDDTPAILQYLNGFEHLKQRLRGAS